ncbi:MAG: DUF5680 domain-containing protein [Chloroflexota bacterium]
MILPIPQENLLGFLLNAKRYTYASQEDDAAVKPLVRGSRQLEFRQGALFYRDIYFGGEYFVGQETVYFKSDPVWGMSYAGGVIQGIEADEIAGVFSFLKSALQKVTAEAPFRGPASFQSGAFHYTNRSLGNLERFSGTESINYENRSIYHLHYSGGLLR